jgi:hypothetical protein
VIPGLRAIPATIREWNNYFSSFEKYGTETVTLTGFTTTVTGLIVWCKIGRRVTITLPSAISGTSNTTAFTMTGLPKEICPETVKRGLVEATDNGTDVVALFSLSGTTLTLSTDAPFSATGWTNSGTKGLSAGWQCSWLLDT